MLKVLIGIGVGVLLWSNPEARRITAHVLRGTADYLDQGTTANSVRQENPPLPFSKRVPPLPLLND